jgi:hypothetical protein
MFEKRINIFTGHFGSGKTEIAVNYAIKLSDVSENTAIVDLDIVNPFFRTADARTDLEKKGIWVVLPMYANSNVDVPALPPEIYSVFNRTEYKGVFDVGGDDIGALALSRYRDEITSEDYDMFFVVNTKRPFTDTTSKIDEMMESIEQSSRLKITGLINNTNLLQYTTRKDILEGQKMLEEISGLRNVPISITSGFFTQMNMSSEGLKGEILDLNKYILLPWDKK